MGKIEFNLPSAPAKAGVSLDDRIKSNQPTKNKHAESKAPRSPGSHKNLGLQDKLKMNLDSIASLSKKVHEDGKPQPGKRQPITYQHRDKQQARGPDQNSGNGRAAQKPEINQSLDARIKSRKQTYNPHGDHDGSFVHGDADTERGRLPGPQHVGDSHKDKGKGKGRSTDDRQRSRGYPPGRASPEPPSYRSGKHQRYKDHDALGARANHDSLDGMDEGLLRKMIESVSEQRRALAEANGLSSFDQDSFYDDDLIDDVTPTSLSDGLAALGAYSPRDEQFPPGLIRMSQSPSVDRGQRQIYPRNRSRSRSPVAARPAHRRQRSPPAGDSSRAHASYQHGNGSLHARHQHTTLSRSRTSSRSRSPDAGRHEGTGKKRLRGNDQQRHLQQRHGPDQHHARDGLPPAARPHADQPPVHHMGGSTAAAGAAPSQQLPSSMALQPTLHAEQSIPLSAWQTILQLVQSGALPPSILASLPLQLQPQSGQQQLQQLQLQLPDEQQRLKHLEEEYNREAAKEQSASAAPLPLHPPQSSAIPSLLQLPPHVQQLLVQAQMQLPSTVAPGNSAAQGNAMQSMLPPSFNAAAPSLGQQQHALVVGGNQQQVPARTVVVVTQDQLQNLTPDQLQALVGQAGLLPGIGGHGEPPVGMVAPNGSSFVQLPKSSSGALAAMPAPMQLGSMRLASSAVMSNGAMQPQQLQQLQPQQQSVLTSGPALGSFAAMQQPPPDAAVPQPPMSEAQQFIHLAALAHKQSSAGYPPQMSGYSSIM